MLYTAQVKKLIIILGGVAVISLVCLWLVLLAVKFYILTEATSMQSMLHAAGEKYQTEDFLLYRQRILDANVQFGKVNTFAATTTSVARALEFISGIQKPAGVKLTRISAKQQADAVNLAIFGVSDTRDNLMALKIGLENSAAVQRMDFPSNNWLKPANLDFYLTFDYVQK